VEMGLLVATLSPTGMPFTHFLSAHQFYIMAVLSLETRIVIRTFSAERWLRGSRERLMDRKWSAR
jgi:hypothetical protein